MVRRGQGGAAGAVLCEGSRGPMVAPLDALVEAGWLGCAPLKERENALSDDF
jgi:hypothetical protein